MTRRSRNSRQRRKPWTRMTARRCEKPRKRTSDELWWENIEGMRAYDEELVDEAREDELGTEEDEARDDEEGEGTADEDDDNLADEAADEVERTEDAAVDEAREELGTDLRKVVRRLPPERM